MGLAAADAVGADALNLALELRKLYETSERLLARCEAEGDLRGALLGVGQALQCLRMAAQLALMTDLEQRVAALEGQCVAQRDSGS